MSQEFEGQEISEFIAVIPSMKLEAPDSYQRGTYLTLNVEVRVRSVRYEEVTSGKNKGDLQKVHVLAIENVSVAETITPQQRQAILEAAAKQMEIDAGIVDAEVVSDSDDLEVPQIEAPTAYTAEEKTDDWVYESPEYQEVHHGAEPAEAGVGF